MLLSILLLIYYKLIMEHMYRCLKF